MIDYRKKLATDKIILVSSSSSSSSSSIVERALGRKYFKLNAMFD